MEITREQFEEYLKIQASGLYNMFDSKAIKLSGLSEEVYIRIIGRYSDLIVQYKDLYDEYMGNK